MKQTSWNSVHTWYDNLLGTYGDNSHQTILIPRIVKLLTVTNASVILDIGCGQGILARSLPNHCVYIGIDISPNLIADAKKRDSNKNHRYLVGDCTKNIPVPSSSITDVVSLLTIDNIEEPFRVFKEVARVVAKNGNFIFVINHPCFRIPRQSSWGIDEKNKLQYRRINRYLSPLKIPITMHPGQQQSPITWTFHFPLSSYISWLSKEGFVVTKLEEWSSEKTSSGKFKTMENRARSEFPLFLAIQATKTFNPLF